MTIPKLVKYNLVTKKNQISDDSYNVRLNVSESSGNYLVHKDILRHQMSQKQGTVSTKTRKEVKGGGQKPWRQKGTGRARAGSNRSPLWKGGGVTFGPKPKKINLKLNKKEKKLALQTLLYNKRKNIWIINNLENLLSEPKTKTIYNIFKEYKFNLNKKLLIVVFKKSIFLKLSTRNLKNIELISVKHLNTFSLLKAKQIILTLPALYEIKEIFYD